MSRLESLPSDQRAVLALVLQRGRSYEEIAEMLGIDRAAVRRRALDALGALHPGAVEEPSDPDLVGDYLLGQLPERVAAEVHQYIAVSDSDRRWARAIALELAPLAPGALPEVPVAAEPDLPVAAAEPEVITSSPPPPSAPESSAPARAAAPRDVPIAPTPPRAPVAGGGPHARHERRTRRPPGAVIAVAAGTLIALVVVLAAVLGGGSGHAKPKHGAPSVHPTTSVSSSPRTAPTRVSGPQTLATLSLAASSRRSAATGVAKVLRRAGVVAIVLDARGLPANGPHNAYAVWLSSGPGRSWLVGFVPAAVGRSGRLQTEGRLPADAGQYRRLLLTVETSPDPTHPGPIVLSSAFRE